MNVWSASISGVPAAFYNVTYGVAMQVTNPPSGGVLGHCRLQSFRLDIALQSTALNVGGDIDLVGAGFLNYEGDNTWLLICAATAAGIPKAWSESIDQPPRLTLTRVDTVVSGSLSASTP